MNRICRDNEWFVCVTVTGIKHNKYRDCNHIKIYDNDGRQKETTFYNEFCTAELKKGDKILITINRVDDPEFGKLVKKDAFIYNGDSYKRCYQVYFPNKDKLEYADLRDTTRAIQQRNQTANISEKKIER